MFLLWPLVIFISSFKYIFQLKDKSIPNFNCNFKTFQNYALRSISVSNEVNCNCLPSDLKDDFSNLDLNKFMLCLLKWWKSDSTKFTNFVTAVKAFINLIDLLKIDTSKFSKIGRLIFNITKENINNDSMILQITNIINKTNFTGLIIEFLLYSFLIIIYFI